MYFYKTEKQLLPRSDNRISFLYVDKGRIEQTEYSIQVVRKDTRSEIPIATIGALFLGPGTTITHEAVKCICDVGCTIIWCGMDVEQWRFYAVGNPGTVSSKNLLKQMNFYGSKTLHMKVIREMYKIRYPSDHLSRKSLAELRGIEGQHVKDLYNELAERYGIKWEGRSYRVDDFAGQDEINQAITVGNQVLYGIVKSVLHLTGFSPAIGFIHTGKMDSFVYDVADLYKETISIPTAFFVVSQNPKDISVTMREKMREKIVEKKLLKKISKDLKMLFECTDEEVPEIDELHLWDSNENVKAGRNYARNM